MSITFGRFTEAAEQEDPKAKRLKMLKRQVLMKKVQAVRQGGGEDITASHEPEGQELNEYSPNVTYQAKGGKKSGKLGKSSVYSLKDKGESKKEFRKSHTKDIKDGLLKKEEVKKERHPRDQKELDRAQAYIKKNPNFGKKDVKEAKVDAGKSPETKEKDRNVRKFGVSHNVSGHGKLRRSLHKMNRGDKKIKGDKSAWTEMESVQYEGVGDAVKAGVKRHKDAVEKKKIKNRKAVPYAALAAEHQPEGEMVEHHQKDKDGKVIEHEDTAPCSVEEELSRRSKPSAKAKMAKLDAILKRREERKIAEKQALKTEGWLGKKKEEKKKPQKAMDAGARAKRKLQRREYAAKVSGSEDNVPDEMREGVAKAAGNALGYAARVGAGIVGAGVQALSQKETIPKVSGAKKGGTSSAKQGSISAAQSQAEKAKKAKMDARKKAIKKIKDDRRERATNIMTAEKAAKKVKKEGEDKKFKADSTKPIVAEFVNNLWEASHKCKKCGKVYTGKSCSCGC